MLDTHAVAQSLTAVEFTPAQFKAGIAEMRAEQRAEIAGVRTEIANLDTRLSTQIADLRTEQRTAISVLEARMAAMETRLTWRIVGGVAAVGAILRLLA